MRKPQHRRRAYLLSAAGLAVVTAAAISALADVSGDVREWVTSEAPSPSPGRADALRVSLQGSGFGDASCLLPEYVVRGGLEALHRDPAPPESLLGPDEAAAWFTSHNATATADTVVFVVENLQHGSAVVRDLRAVVDSWEPAPDAVRVVPTGTDCGGHLEVQQYDIRLRDTKMPINAVAHRRSTNLPIRWRTTTHWSSR